MSIRHRQWTWLAAIGLLGLLDCARSESIGDADRPIAAPPQALWSSSFAGGHWAEDWQAHSEKSWGGDRIERIEEPGGRFPTFLRVSYPSYSCSPVSATIHGTPEGGAQFLATARLSPTNAIHLRYHVRFHGNFPFVKGGKLPGLFGGDDHFSGGGIPDGTNGFSVRFMWRADGNGEAYAYLPTGKAHGESIGRGRWRFRPGYWHCLEQRIVLNTPGLDDGRLTVWVDGERVIDERTLRYRTTDALQIRGIFFSTFFGGGDPSWSTPIDTHADFADFALFPVGIAP